MRRGRTSVTTFNELDIDTDEDADRREDVDVCRKGHSVTNAVGFLFGGAWVPTTIVIVTAIVIGLFIELRFHDAWSLYIW